MKISLRSLGVVSGLLLATVGFAREGHAASSDCMSKLGSCQISNDDDTDMLSCECAGDGAGGGLVGGDQWAGLSEEELTAACAVELELFCGEIPPPKGLLCEDDAGNYCVIENNPNWISCDCGEAGGDGGDGGNEWDDYTDEQLLEQCASELEATCDDGEGTTGPGDTGGEDTGGEDTGGEDTGGEDTGGEDTGGEDTGGEDTGGGTADSGGDEAGTTDGGAGTRGGDAGTTGAEGGHEGGDTGGTTGGDTEGASGGGDGDDDDSNGCSVGGRSTASLFLLGLLGLARRRRRH